MLRSSILSVLVNFMQYRTVLKQSIPYTRWFKYDRDYLCVNKSQFVPVIFEPPCSCIKHSSPCSAVLQLSHNGHRRHYAVLQDPVPFSYSLGRNTFRNQRRTAALLTIHFTKLHRIGWYDLHQGCTNRRGLVAWATTFCTAEPNHFSTIIAVPSICMQKSVPVHTHRAENVTWQWGSQFTVELWVLRKELASRHPSGRGSYIFGNFMDPLYLTRKDRITGEHRISKDVEWKTAERHRRMHIEDSCPLGRNVVCSLQVQTLWSGLHHQGNKTLELPWRWRTQVTRQRRHVTFQNHHVTVSCWLTGCTDQFRSCLLSHRVRQTRAVETRSAELTSKRITANFIIVIRH